MALDEPRSPPGRRSDRCLPAPRARPGTVVVCLLAVSLALAVGVVTVGTASSAPTTNGRLIALQTDGPTATVTASPNPANPGELVTIDATASTAGANESIVECAFDTNGDGTFDQQAGTCRIERQYDVVGTYDVAVRVTTSADRTATASETVVVRTNRAPRPAIAVDPAVPIAGQEVTLSGATSSDPDGDVVSYTWSVDGRTLTGETVTLEFADPDEYEVTLSIVDDDGAENEIAGTVTVRANQPPTAELVVDPPQVRPGETVAVDASASTDPDGSVVAYRWDLDGDGTVDRTTDGPVAEFTADDAGERSIVVTVVDDLEATGEASASLIVTQPEANATATPDGDGSGDAPDGDLRDPGIVPVVPDWLALLVVIGLVALGGIHRKQPIPQRLREWRERRSEGELRRDAAEKGVGFAAKTVFKRLFRLLADAVEGSGDAVGALLEWVGKAIRRVASRIASVLRRLG